MEQGSVTTGAARKTINRYFENGVQQGDDIVREFGPTAYVLNLKSDNSGFVTIGGIKISTFTYKLTSDRLTYVNRVYYKQDGSLESYPPENYYHEVVSMNEKTLILNELQLIDTAENGVIKSNIMEVTYEKLAN